MSFQISEHFLVILKISATFLERPTLRVVFMGKRKYTKIEFLHFIMLKSIDIKVRRLTILPFEVKKY